MSTNNSKNNISHPPTLQQEFDEFFSSSYLQKASRQNSAFPKSRFSSEHIQDPDEDFSEINSLIHDEVITPDVLQASPFFKDLFFPDDSDAINPPQNLIPSSKAVDESQIDSIIGEVGNSSSSQMRLDRSDCQSSDAALNLEEGDAWPEGWVSLLKSLQRESVNLSVHQALLSNTIQKTVSEPKVQSSNAIKEEKRNSVISIPNRTNSEVTTNNNNDKALESNPYYKLKSKKELEEERKNKAKTNITSKKQNNVSKPDSIKNVDKPSTVKHEEPEARRKDSYSQPSTIQYENGYNGSSYVLKKDQPKNTYSERTDHRTEGNNRQNDYSYANGNKKGTNKKDQRVGSSYTNIQPIKDQVSLKHEREKEEKLEVKKKASSTIPPKEVKPEKEERAHNPEVRRSEEKVIENKKKQPEVLNIEKRPSEILTIDQSISDEKSFSVDQREEISQRDRHDTQEDEEERTSVSQSISLSESKSVVQEEFISLNIKSRIMTYDYTNILLEKKTKVKTVETSHLGSKKQALMDQVKKETGMLRQNQFTALQSMNAQAASGFVDFAGDDNNSEENESVEEPTVVVEKTKKSKSKKKKKAEAKQETKAEIKQDVESKADEKGPTNEKEIIKSVKTSTTVTTKANGGDKITIKEEKVIKTVTEEKAAQPANINKDIMVTKEKEVLHKVEIQSKTSAPHGKIEDSHSQKAAIAPTEEEEEEDDDESKAAVEGQGGDEATKKKKKKKKKNKAKGKEENVNTVTTPLNGEGEAQKNEENKPDIKLPKNSENEGSTEDDDPGNSNGLKSDFQISKSKKKKLKKKAKQLTLCECLKNAEMKLTEFKNEYFLESSVFSDDPMILDRFKKLLNIQKEMASEVRGGFVRECFEDRGSLGESRIKFQVTLKKNGEGEFEEVYSADKKPKKKKEKNILQEVVEATSADFDSLKKILSEDVNHFHMSHSEGLEANEELDNVMETIGYLETLIKDKAEVQNNNKPEIDFEDLENMPLHLLLETIEKDKLRAHDIFEGFGGFLTSNSGK